MNIELRVDGEAIIKMELNAALLSQLLTISLPALGAETIAKSTPMTKAQAQELLSRIDSKSAHFLKLIAANNGNITWGEMKDIFGITDWTAFSAGHGKGITRALRHILDNKSARLLWWNDAEWKDEEGNDLDPSEQDSCPVYIDGAALHALQEAGGIPTQR
jgi:hypothetical protein